jgi:oxalate decarboxylase/phosphoglucose isomerase-like protein (cupin superfamily)
MRLLAMLSVCCAYLFGFEDQVKVDNHVVHIVEVVNAPHTTRTMFGHETNRVLISLGAGNIQRTYADGRRGTSSGETGQALWIPVGESYASENIGSTPMRFIEIELKKHGPAKPAARSHDLDPIAIDPEHNVLVLENEQVRVFRSWREPGATEKMHEHTGAGRVAVLLTDLNATVKAADGATSALRASSGDVLWSGTVTHATTNLGSKKFDMVVVEVK